MIYIIIRFFLQVIFLPLHILPYKWQWGFCTFLARFALSFNDKRTRISFINLDLVFPDLSSNEKKKLVLSSYANLFMYFFDVINALYVYDINKRAEIEYENEDAKKFVKDTKVVLSAHIGSVIYCLFLPQVALARSRYYAPVREEGVFKFVVNLLALKKTVIIGHKNVNVIKLLEDINETAGIYLAYDQWVGKPLGMDGTLFGRKTGVMKFPAIMVRRMTERIVYYVFHTRTDSKYGKFKVYRRVFDNNLTIEELTAEMQKFLEKIVTENKEYWWWLHDRWKETPNWDFPSLYKEDLEKYKKKVED